ncbi:S66 peptidase family protein [Flavicella sediminum]|uniref:S66 peptidase family protein n=1 Tax=Flavicella sediminum TaxID=2585141 RepID=UPI00112066CC|nr:LD-carboxypeptidase [Flavicella sediminum]
MMTPAYLKPGDTIAIVAPAGIIKNKASIHEAAALAKSWGLEVVLGKHIFDAYHHFSATDDHRLLDFQTALDQPNIKAIWCARGGYGTVRIIDDIDFSSFKKTPKWIIGYSDITVLHNAVHNLGVETLHAMMPVNMEFSESSRRQSVATFKKALFGEKLNYEIPSSSYNKTGNCKGVLVGGNLTLLENLLGSSSSISTAGKILFFEEIGEYKYHIDRLIRALDRNGYFTNCKGLLIGGMSHIKKNNPPFGQNIEELILAITETYNFPIAFDFPAGHDPENNALIFGRTVEMEISSTSTKINFTK